MQCCKPSLLLQTGRKAGRRVEKFCRSTRFKILITVIAVLFGFMLYSAYTGGIATLPERLLSYITVPVQKATSAVSDGLSGFFGKYINADETQELNQQLQDEIDQLRKDLTDYESTRRENEELKKYLGIKDQNPDYKFVSANVISRDPNNKYETFKIDVGTIAGVDKFDPIITTNGNDPSGLTGCLVGIVESVGPMNATVRTILSPQLEGVGAYDVTMPDQMGLVVGDIKLAESGLCKMEYLTKSLKVGDQIVTSGSSGIYPKGLTIGKVRYVRMQSYGTSYYAEITPAADFQKLQNVMVITDFLGKGIDQNADASADSEE